MDDEKVERIIADVLGVSVTTVTDEMTANDVEEWDSFAQVNLMVALEEEFAVRMDGERFMTLRSVRDVRAALVEQLRRV